jgi:serine/threonine protein kinase
VHEILDAKYMLLRKLGWGHFSTVWLALKLQDKNLYALKIQKSADKYTESALEEEEILNDVANNYKHPKWETAVRKYLGDPNLEVTRAQTHNL